MGSALATDLHYLVYDPNQSINTKQGQPILTYDQSWGQDRRGTYAATKKQSEGL